MKPDFSGYATRAGVKCTDGLTIMRDAFKHQDKVQVPLVWQHGHSDPTNVLGHAILENRDDGVYAYAFFNETAKAQHAREMVAHKDIKSLSIYANELIKRSSHVLHGVIREVSLVLAGANPGATIESITIRHSDDDGLYEDYELEDEAIIHSGLDIELSEELAHEDSTDDDSDNSDDGEETVADIYETMNEKQKNVLQYLVGEALAVDVDEDEDDDDDSASHSNLEDEDNTMGTHYNVFEGTGQKDMGTTLSHDDMKGIFASADRSGSLKHAVEEYALAHGITNIGQLFPEATQLTTTPDFYARRMEWVNDILGSARKTPFSRVRTAFADITMEEARAKGYVTGNMKKEEFFSVAKRETTPTTIYKKQKLERDDLIDITDFDVVAWLRAEMRVMLDEELARAVLVGDGRDPSSTDKINEGNIRPIAKDHELYTTPIFVNLDDVNSSITEVIDTVVENRSLYRGSGLPTFYTTEAIIAKFLLLKDNLGRRIYKNLEEVASELRVRSIVPVEVLSEYDDIVGIMVNMADYNIGADKGGEVSMFDDFDIDYNQYKYLLETRCSGALTKLKSAIVIKKTDASSVLVVPTAPTYNAATGALTITNTTGVVYKNAAAVAINAAGSPYTVAAETKYVVTATPAAGYHFAAGTQKQWTFTGPDA